MPRSVYPATLACALAACSTATGADLPASGAPNDRPLRASVARLADAWNAGDGARWAAEYWPDGSLVNILGVVFPSAIAVGAVTDRILAGPFKGSKFAAVVRRVRFIGESAAIVDVDVDVTSFRALPPGAVATTPGAVATTPGVLTTRLTNVFERRDGVWKIEASQNTAVSPASIGQ